jgi:hypothetical protein
MFKPHTGTCSCCGQPGFIVVKKGLRQQCNERKKKESKSGRKDAAVRGRYEHSVLSGSDPHAEDIEGYTTVFRQPIRKKAKAKPGRHRTSQDQIRKKVDFGRAAGLQGITRLHTLVYYKALGYTVADFVPCEVCGLRAVDIHHIEARGAGGDPSAGSDKIENLMALCRDHHVEYGDKRHFKEWLISVHFDFLNNNGVEL